MSTTPTTAEPLTGDALRKAMARVWSLGQTYWQQADSESYAQNKKSDATREKYLAFVEETVAALATPPEIAQPATPEPPLASAPQVAEPIPKGYIVIDKELLAQAIFTNTDASLAEARHIINTTLKVSDSPVYRAAGDEV